MNQSGCSSVKKESNLAQLLKPPCCSIHMHCELDKAFGRQAGGATHSFRATTHSKFVILCFQFENTITQIVIKLPKTDVPGLDSFLYFLET